MRAYYWGSGGKTGATLPKIYDRQSRTTILSFGHVAVQKLFTFAARPISRDSESHKFTVSPMLFHRVIQSCRRRFLRAKNARLQGDRQGSEGFGCGQLSSKAAIGRSKPRLE